MKDKTTLLQILVRGWQVRYVNVGIIDKMVGVYFSSNYIGALYKFHFKIGLI